MTDPPSLEQVEGAVSRGLELEAAGDLSAALVEYERATRWATDRLAALPESRNARSGLATALACQARMVAVDNPPMAIELAERSVAEWQVVATRPMPPVAWTRYAESCLATARLEAQFAPGERPAELALACVDAATRAIRDGSEQDISDALRLQAAAFGLLSTLAKRGGHGDAAREFARDAVRVSRERVSATPALSDVESAFVWSQLSSQLQRYLRALPEATVDIRRAIALELRDAAAETHRLPGSPATQVAALWATLTAGVELQNLGEDSEGARILNQVITWCTNEELATSGAVADVAREIEALAKDALDGRSPSVPGPTDTEEL